MSSILHKNSIRDTVSSEKNAQANLRSRYIVYSTGNSSICLVNLT